MRKFILGVIVTLLVLILGGLGFAMLGFFPPTPNVAPPRFEHHIAKPPSTPPWSGTLLTSPTPCRPPTRTSRMA